ncbi:MAG: aspartate-semialdehyde dehydrogenase [Clostridia bacterium]|nr:aspartate-semialdehyde dehydrogenase [Clostridia bacterium]
MRIAIVGASGMVGRMFLRVLEEKQLPIDEYVLFSSSRSAGQKVFFMNQECTFQELTESSFDSGFDYALFSAGASTSKKFAPIAKEKGCTVIDNSSCWRMDPQIPLVVPEVNPETARQNKIIANPNCSTIQAVVALKPLYDKYGIKRIIYSTYQAVSGAGLGGFNDLKNNTSEKFPYPITANCIPHIDVFEENGYTKEEMKMINETRKILNDYSLQITATTVRVPVFFGHSESINVELKQPFEIEEVRELFRNAPGVVLQDDISKNLYPMPILAENKDEVFIGRIRRDYSIENGLNLWVVADNLRKGAASNAVQILEKLINSK